MAAPSLSDFIPKKLRLPLRLSRRSSDEASDHEVWVLDCYMSLALTHHLGC